MKQQKKNAISHQTAEMGIGRMSLAFTPERPNTIVLIVVSNNLNICGYVAPCVILWTS